MGPVEEEAVEVAGGFRESAIVDSPFRMQKNKWIYSAQWRLLLAVSGLLIALAAPILQLRLMTPELPWPRSDMAPVALGVRATLKGRDPYSVEVTREIQTAFYGRPLTAADHEDEQHFAYPAYAAVVLAPLAALPWTTTEYVFLVVMPLLTAASVLLWLGVLGIKLSRGRLAAAMVLTVASWPVMWSLRLCQVTLLLALLVAVGCWLIRRRHDVPAGVLLCLTTIKPQTTGPLLLWLLIWACLQRRWWFVISFLGTAAALLISADSIAPGWFPHWLGTAAEYARYTRIHPMLQFVFGRWLGGALMLAIMAGSSVALWRMRRCLPGSADFGVAISLVLALTLCLYPTSPGMSYNDVVLLPALLILLHRVSAGRTAHIAQWITVRMLWAGFVVLPLQVAGELTWGYSKLWSVLVVVTLLLLPSCATVALGFYANELSSAQAS